MSFSEGHGHKYKPHYMKERSPPRQEMFSSLADNGSVTHPVDR